MAEVAALGLVASIVQLVSFSAEVIQRLNEYKASYKDVPRAFQQICIQLPLLKSNLERTKEQVQADQLDDKAREAVLQLIKECQVQVEVFELISTSVLPQYILYSYL